MSTRGARVARGLVAAGFATFIAALFHVAGGGVPPSALALTLSLTFSGLACIALAGKRSRVWRSAASVALSQFVFHGLFSLNPSGQFAGATGHIHPGSHLMLIPGQPAAETMTHDGGAMWMSHIVAAALTLVILRYGERTFRAVCDFAVFQLRRVLGTLTFGVSAAPARRVRVETVPVILPQLTELLGGFRHRGPPMAVRPA